MEKLIKIILIYVIIMLVIKVFSNKGHSKKYNSETVNKKVIHQKRITKNGQTINIKRTYINGELVDQLDEGADILEEDFFKNHISNIEQEKIQKMNEFLNNPSKTNNNRHNYLYQDIEKEIIKVDHTFSKEVFLNNAKELFLKYYNSMIKGEAQELQEFLTEGFYKIVQNKIEENKLRNINVIAEKIYIYNAFLHEFSKSTDNQVITVKIIAEMKNYEIDTVTQVVTKGNQYAKTKIDYEMQFERKTKSLICKSCGAPVNMKDLSVCEYCNTPIEVEDNEWKLNYINILKD